MKKKRILSFVASFTALVVFHDEGHGAVTAGELARIFAGGLRSRSAFEEMNEIFLNENDFDSFVLMVKNIQGIAPETVARARNRDEVGKARKVFLRDREGFKKIWEGAVKKSADEKSTAEYTGHTVKTAVRDGLTVYEIEISFTVSREGKKDQGGARVTAFMLDGKMKIAELGQLKT